MGWSGRRELEWCWCCVLWCGVLASDRIFLKSEVKKRVTMVCLFVRTSV